MVTDFELSQLSEEYLKLLGIYDEQERKIQHCFYCGKYGVYLDYTGVDYNNPDSRPILRNASDNESHYCMNMHLAKGSADRTFISVQ